MKKIIDNFRKMPCFTMALAFPVYIQLVEGEWKDVLLADADVSELFFGPQHAGQRVQLVTCGPRPDPYHL
jgi:hypothetical protein